MAGIKRGWGRYDFIIICDTEEQYTKRLNELFDAGYEWEARERSGMEPRTIIKTRLMYFPVALLIIGNDILWDNF